MGSVVSCVMTTPTSIKQPICASHVQSRTTLFTIDLVCYCLDLFDLLGSLEIK